MNNAPPTQPLLQILQLGKSYLDGKNRLHVFANLNLSLTPGQTVAIIGRSGSGKTTLLHNVAGLETFDKGQIIFSGTDTQTYNNRDWDRYRLHEIGLIFQFHFLLPDFTACENVALALIINGVSRTQALAQARESLREVGLIDRAEHQPSALSGGERQRVAIARALIHQPKLIIADEPTGNLDEQTAGEMIDLLLQQVHTKGTALIVATHDVNLVKKFDVCLELHPDGLRDSQ